MKLLHIIGARPQFIKYFPVQEAILKEASRYPIENRLIHTGQHYDYLMSKVFFDELGIRPPDYHLEVGSGNHGQQTALVLQRVEDILLKEKPDVTIVYGDTNSTLGGALAASKLHIPIAHVEAGLRSFNKAMPEEINRILTDHVSAVLFCPSKSAINNLQKEGFTNIYNNGDLAEVPLSCSLTPDHPLIMNVGDVMYDILLHALDLAKQKSCILTELALAEEDYALLTLHRAENTDDLKILETIIRFINDTTAGQTVIFPMHPRMIKVYGQARGKFAPHVRIIEPVSYFDLLMLLGHAARLFTDSGGMQKEACWLKVPCITIREETEWLETIQSGGNILYRNYQGFHQPKSEAVNAYGDGKAAEKIINTLLKRRD